jgi:hypothetical protein
MVDDYAKEGDEQLKKALKTQYYILYQSHPPSVLIVEVQKAILILFWCRCR